MHWRPRFLSLNSFSTILFYRIKSASVFLLVTFDLISHFVVKYILPIKYYILPIKYISGMLCLSPFRHRQCIGTAQHLKSKFGEGYTLEMHTSFSSSSSGSSSSSSEISAENARGLAAVVEFATTHLAPGARVQESFGGRLVFALPRAGLSLPRAFREIEVHDQSFHAHTCCRFVATVR